MKIAFVLTHFLPYQIAGTEIYTWALAKSLRDKEHNVIIVTPNYNSLKSDEYEYDGLRVVRYAEKNIRDRKLRAGKRPPDGISAFKTLIREENPDIVNVQEFNQSSGIGMYHLEILNALSIPVIATFHLARYSCHCGTLMYKNKEVCNGVIRISKCTSCALSQLPLNPVTQTVLHAASMALYKLNINTSNTNSKAGTGFAYPFIIKKLEERLHEVALNCKKIIVLSEWFKSVLLLNNIPPEKIQLIRQGLTYQNEKTVKETSENGNSLRLAFMSRIHPIKGLDILLEALDNFDENEIQLDIFGEHTESAYFKQLKQKAINKKNIHWKGTIDQKAVVNTMQLYEAIIIPSITCEMAPLLIQEAFAAGVPVIGSDVKGIAEQVFQGVNGLLFTMGNVSELKQVFENLLNDRSILKELSRNIKVPRSFGEVSKETLLLYEAVLANESGYKNKEQRVLLNVE